MFLQASYVPILNIKDIFYLDKMRECIRTEGWLQKT